MTAGASYLYCIEIAGSDAGKIGVSCNPLARLASIRQAAPFKMVFRRVIRMPGARAASECEAQVIAAANRYRKKGEWVVVDDRLDAILDALPGENVTEDFAGPDNSGRHVARDSEIDDAKIRKAVFSDTFGAHAAVCIGFSGQLEDQAAATVKARLIDGYGVEDIAALDGIPVEVSRRVIGDLRDSGQLIALLAHIPTEFIGRAQA